MEHNKLITGKFSNKILPYPLRAIAKTMGIPHNAAIPAEVETLIQESYTTALSLIDIKYRYKIIKINELKGSTITLDDGINFTSLHFKNSFTTSSSVILYVLTTGAPISDKIDDLMDAAPDKGYALDIMASNITDYSSLHFLVKLFLEANEQGENITDKYSPGYCTWNITEQKNLFKILKPEDIGITLTETCLMIPRKSVSGIFGLGPKESLVRTSACNLCKDSKCDFRRDDIHIEKYQDIIEKVKQFG